MALVRPAKLPFAKVARALPYRTADSKLLGTSFGDGFINGCIERGLTDDQIADVMVKTAVAVGPENFNRLLSRKSLNKSDQEIMVKAALVSGLARAAFNVATKSLPSLVRSIPGAVGSAYNTVASVAPGAIRSIPGTVSSAYNTVASAAPGAIKSIPGLGAKAVGAIKANPTASTALGIGMSTEVMPTLFGGQPIVTSFADDQFKNVTGHRLSNFPGLGWTPVSRNTRQQESSDAFNAALADPDVTNDSRSLQKALDANYMMPSRTKKILNDFVGQEHLPPDLYKEIMQQGVSFTDEKALKNFLSNTLKSYDAKPLRSRKAIEQALIADGQDPAQAIDRINSIISREHGIPVDKLPWNRNRSVATAAVAGAAGGAVAGNNAPVAGPSPTSVAQELGADPAKLEVIKPEHVSQMQTQLKTSMNTLQSDLAAGKIDKETALKTAHIYYKQSQSLASIAVSKAAGKVIPMAQLEQMAKANDPTLLSMAKQNLESDPAFAKFVEANLPKYKGDVEAASSGALMDLWNNLGQGPLGVGGQIAVAGGLLSAIVGLISMTMGGDGLGLMGMGLGSLAAGFAQSPMGLGGLLQSGSGLIGNGLDFIKNIFNREGQPASPQPATTSAPVATPAAPPRPVTISPVPNSGNPVAAARSISNTPPGPNRAAQLAQAIPFQTVKAMTNGYVDQAAYNRMLQRAATDNNYLNALISFAERSPRMGLVEKMNEGSKLMR